MAGLNTRYDYYARSTLRSANVLIDGFTTDVNYFARWRSGRVHVSFNFCLLPELLYIDRNNKNLQLVTERLLHSSNNFIKYDIDVRFSARDALMLVKS